MTERKDKNGRNLRRKILVAGLAFLLLVLLITSLFGKKGLIEIYRAKKSYSALLEEIERLKQEKARLEREIAELEKNPRAVDKEAREKLWLMKENETVIVRKSK